ncbi:hypothetical protein BH11ACT6_BH11ACT6_35400 [soil metagenome]
MSIENATTLMTQLADSGQADLKMSTETRDEYLKVINALRDSLKGRLAEVDEVEPYGDPGLYASAKQTKANLELAVLNFKKSVNDYIEYLDAFAETVKKACDRAIESG